MSSLQWAKEFQLVSVRKFLNHAPRRMNQTLIIVPTFNERDNLPRMAAKLLSLPVEVDVLVVDDNSPDGTGKIADELAARHPQIHVLHRMEKDGLGRAYLAGFKWALERHYEFIFEMDCDFSHDPEEIPNFLKAAKNADLVLGSRYDGGVRVLNWPLKRLLLSRCAGIYVWIITGMPFTDPTGGYKCFHRRALQAIDLDAVHSNGYSFQIEMTHRLWRNGYKVTEVPITFADRVQGTSKLSRHIVHEAFWMVWWLWIQNGCRRWPRRKRPESRIRLPAPRETMAGCVWLPRILAKARLLKRGDLPPDYAARFCSPTGVDDVFLGHFNLTRDDVTAAAEKSDSEVTDWFSSRTNPSQIEEWNQIALNLGRPGFPMAERFSVALATTYKHIDARGKTSVFEILEADEQDV